MSEVSATEAARNFADLLDAVEHRNERFTIVRRGRVVAQLEPASKGRGADVKAILRARRPDAEWAEDLAEVRGLLTIDERW
jgi:prevent-host-death family protein